MNKWIKNLSERVGLNCELSNFWMDRCCCYCYCHFKVVCVWVWAKNNTTQHKTRMESDKTQQTKKDRERIWRPDLLVWLLFTFSIWMCHTKESHDLKTSDQTHVGKATQTHKSTAVMMSSSVRTRGKTRLDLPLWKRSGKSISKSSCVCHIRKMPLKVPPSSSVYLKTWAFT